MISATATRMNRYGMPQMIAIETNRAIRAGSPGHRAQEVTSARVASVAAGREALAGLDPDRGRFSGGVRGQENLGS